MEESGRQPIGGGGEVGGGRVRRAGAADPEEPGRRGVGVGWVGEAANSREFAANSLETAETRRAGAGRQPMMEWGCHKSSKFAVRAQGWERPTLGGGGGGAWPPGSGGGVGGGRVRRAGSEFARICKFARNSENPAPQICWRTVGGRMGGGAADPGWRQKVEKLLNSWGWRSLAAREWGWVRTTTTTTLPACAS